MDLRNEKRVMIIDENLPSGLIANTAAIMGITPGKEMPAVDFSDLAQGCKTYSEFLEKMAATLESALQFLGLAICGPKKKVNRLTGSMPPLR